MTKHRSRWSGPPQAEENFGSVKTALTTTPAIGLPDYDKMFYLYTHERDGFAKAVLTQQHGDKMRPLAYYSTKLDAVAQGFSPCLRAVAAASYAVQTTSQIVMTSPLVLRVPHCVTQVLLKAKTQHLSTVKAMTYDLVLIQAKKCGNRKMSDTKHSILNANR